MAALFIIASNRKGDVLESCGTVASGGMSTNGKNADFCLYDDNSLSASWRVILRGSRRFVVGIEGVDGMIELGSPKTSTWRT
jgi:hypothetical protein